MMQSFCFLMPNIRKLDIHMFITKDVW